MLHHAMKVLFQNTSRSFSEPRKKNSFEQSTLHKEKFAIRGNFIFDIKCLYIYIHLFIQVHQVNQAMVFFWQMRIKKLKKSVDMCTFVFVNCTIFLSSKIPIFQLRSPYNFDESDLHAHRQKVFKKKQQNPIPNWQRSTDMY